MGNAASTISLSQASVSVCGSIADAFDEKNVDPSAAPSSPILILPSDLCHSQTSPSGKAFRKEISKADMPSEKKKGDATSALFARALMNEVTDNPRTMTPAVMAAREKRLMKAQERHQQENSTHVGNLVQSVKKNLMQFLPEEESLAANPEKRGAYPPNPLQENRAQIISEPNETPGKYSVVIGLSLSRRHSTLGHPDTVTRQTAFDFNELQDRSYKYVSSTDSSGWRAGGGERGGPSEENGNHKIASPDTVHIPIIQIDAGTPAAVDHIINSLASGEVFIPHMSILPEALSVNGVSPPDLVVRFGCERNEDLPPEEWPNWTLEFMHNQLYDYFLGYGARWTKRPFQITLARKVRWRTVKHMNKFFGNSEKVIAAWREKGPQYLNPQLCYIEGGATPEEVARPHGIYLLREGRPTNYFAPNFEPPYTTKMTRSLLMNVLDKSWDRKRRDWRSVPPEKRMVISGGLIGAMCGCENGGTGFIAKGEGRYSELPAKQKGEMIRNRSEGSMGAAKERGEMIRSEGSMGAASSAMGSITSEKMGSVASEKMGSVVSEKMGSTVSEKAKKKAKAKAERKATKQEKVDRTISDQESVERKPTLNESTRQKPERPTKQNPSTPPQPSRSETGRISPDPFTFSPEEEDTKFPSPLISETGGKSPILQGAMRRLKLNPPAQRIHAASPRSSPRISPSSEPIDPLPTTPTKETKQEKLIKKKKKKSKSKTRSHSRDCKSDSSDQQSDSDKRKITPEKPKRKKPLQLPENEEPNKDYSMEASVTESHTTAPISNTSPQFFERERENRKLREIEMLKERKKMEKIEEAIKKREKKLLEESSTKKQESPIKKSEGNFDPPFKLEPSQTTTPQRPTRKMHKTPSFKTPPQLNLAYRSSQASPLPTKQPDHFTFSSPRSSSAPKIQLPTPPINRSGSGDTLEYSVDSNFRGDASVATHNSRGNQSYQSHQSLLSFVTRSTMDPRDMLDGGDESVGEQTAEMIPSDEDLYKIGWAKALDERSGIHYYFTLDRSKTVWENPLLNGTVR